MTKREALKLYCLLIQNRIDNPVRETLRSITEVHHIIPRCVGKYKRLSESKYNLIRLYAHEHFLAHYYLTFIFPNNIGVQRAFYLMSNVKGKRHLKKHETFAAAYEIAKAKVKMNRKNKSYIEIYGPKKAESVKIKQKKSKIDHMIRFVGVDK